MQILFFLGKMDVSPKRDIERRRGLDVRQEFCSESAPVRRRQTRAQVNTTGHSERKYIYILKV